MKNCKESAKHSNCHPTPCNIARLLHTCLAIFVGSSCRLAPKEGISEKPETNSRHTSEIAYGKHICLLIPSHAPGDP